MTKQCATALIVDDQPQICVLIRPVLEHEGFCVEYVDRYEKAEHKLQTHIYDLVILDRNLPDGDGINLLALVAHHALRTRTIVLSQQVLVHQKIEGLEKGADEYIPKPFSLDEFTARVRALIRRTHYEGENCVSYCGLRLFPLEYKIEHKKCSITLTPTLFQLFLLLVKHTNKPVKREEIIREVWPMEKAPSPSTVDVAIKRLRVALHSFPLSIQTVRGIGYMMSPTT